MKPSYVKSSLDFYANRSAYNDRVLRNMLTNEHVYMPPGNYFKKVQTNIKPHMRRIVADWMLEVCEEQQCPEDVFPLAINFMDRFLCTTLILTKQFQLLATTCVFLASKLRMVTPLSPALLVEYTDESITLKELKIFEVMVLNRLRWDMNAITAHDFIDFIIDRLNPLPSVVDPAEVRIHSQVFILMSAADHKLSLLRPSLIASASIGAAIHDLYYSHASSSMRMRGLNQQLENQSDDNLMQVDDIEVALSGVFYNSEDDKLPSLSWLFEGLQQITSIKAEVLRRYTLELVSHRQKKGAKELEDGNMEVS